MNIVLLSGGSGKRLWPLSNETMSKQFLQLLPDGNGGSESMVQRVFRQLKKAIPSANVVVSTNRAQIGPIRRQIGDAARLVIEPERRDTYPAILLSCAYLGFVEKLPRDEAVIVVPIDVFADDGYFETLKTMERAVTSGAYNLVLMGADPTSPSEKYGYVVPSGEQAGGIAGVDSFKEKPDSKTAKRLIAGGALWNCGVFAFKLGYMLDLLKKELPADTFEGVLEGYGSISKLSFDYAVCEKECAIGIVRYSGAWKDLGSWSTITGEMGREHFGKNILSDDGCSDTHVLNMLDLPIITMGISGAVVVASHDGILVSDKETSDTLRSLAEKMIMRPMYEQRFWGEYRVLEYTTDEDGNSTLVKRLHIRAGEGISYQYHFKRTELWTVVAGAGVFTLNGEERSVGRGDVLEIPPLSKHAVRAESDLEIIEVQIGFGELTEEDIVRLT